MRKSLGNYVLKKRASRLKRKVEVQNLESAESVGVVYNATHTEDEEEIKNFIQFLEKQNIKSQSIALFQSKDTSKMPISSINSFYLSKKDLNFYRLPTSEDAKVFMDKDFDILIDCNFENFFPLRYISSLSKAKFKVGPSGSYHQQVCDLTIAMKEPVKMKEFLEQAKHYLKIIKPK